MPMGPRGRAQPYADDHWMLDNKEHTILKVVDGCGWHWVKLPADHAKASLMQVDGSDLGDE